jgi:hypothetical protein
MAAIRVDLDVAVGHTWEQPMEKYTTDARAASPGHTCQVRPTHPVRNRYSLVSAFEVPEEVRIGRQTT